MAPLHVYFLVLSTIGLGNAYLECPPMWTRFRGSCFRFFGQGKTWDDAEAHCGEFFTRYGRGHLASIHSADENDFVLQFLTTSIFIKSNGYDRIWLGMNDKAVEGRFVWTDESPFDYNQWGENEPNSLSSEENCGEFQIGPTPSWLDVPGWNDVTCTREYSYICKMPTSACT